MPLVKVYQLGVCLPTGSSWSVRSCARTNDGRGVAGLGHIIQVEFERRVAAMMRAEILAIHPYVRLFIDSIEMQPGVLA